jgi:hypothetical protein
MSSISLVYIVIRAVSSVVAFFRHWYLGGFFAFVHRCVLVITSLDQTFALRVTMRNLFKPLYQDYTMLGIILGFVFRPLRLIAGGIVYAVIVLVFVALYAVWAAIPLFLIVKTIVG